MMYVLIADSCVIVLTSSIFFRDFNVLYTLFSKMENKIRHISSEKGEYLLVVNAHFDISESKLMNISYMSGAKVL